MERTELFDLMGELKLYGMKAAFDEIMATAVKRQHEPQRIVGDLLTAEIGSLVGLHFLEGFPDFPFGDVERLYFVHGLLPLPDGFS